MPPTPRPILKLKVGKAAALPTTDDTPAPPPVETPTSAGPKKLTIKLNANKKPPPETPTGTTKKKIVFKKKPDQQHEASKKRDSDAMADPEGEAKVPKKKLKVTLKPKPKTPTTPYLKMKTKGQPLIRPKGMAYDSEASDCEEDPMIEEGFILRMIPGDDCEYIRNAIVEKQWGPRSQGGADIRLKFLQADGRRATLTVRGKIYAASLVDMPCIVEGMKSWDKKAWYKASDICQMLLVLGLVKSETEALEFPLPPREVDKESWAYAHGLTPPMRWVRKRRFRHRVSTRTIEAVEEEVERLLMVDNQAAEPVKYEVVDLDRMSRAASARGDSIQPGDDEFMEAEVDADAEGVIEEGGYFDIEAEGEDDEDALAAAFEMGQDEGTADVTEAPTPAESSIAALDTQNVTDSEVATPGAGATSKEDSGDDESDEDDEIDDMDEDAMEQRADLLRAREEIAELETLIKDQIAEMETLGNPILKKRKAEKIQALRSHLDLKKSAIGEGEDD